MLNGGVFVSVPVVSLGSGRIATGVNGLFKIATAHSGSALDHGDTSESMEEARNIFVFGGFGWVVSIEISDADEARRRIIITGKATHQRAGTEGGHFGFAPSNFSGLRAGES